MRITLTTVVLSLCSVVPALAQTAVAEHCPAAADAIVEIDNFAGSIEIKGWDRSRVEVRGTLARDAERLELSGSERRISVRVVVSEERAQDVDSELVIRVPVGSSLRVETVSASVSVHEVHGRHELNTVSGSASNYGGALQTAIHVIETDLASQTAEDKARTRYHLYLLTDSPPTTLASAEVLNTVGFVMTLKGTHGLDRVSVSTFQLPTGTAATDAETEALLKDMAARGTGLYVKLPQTAPFDFDHIAAMLGQ